LVLENLALRQQLSVFMHRYPRPRFKDSDRLFWVLLSRVWRNWRGALHVVQPATVVRWHRQGFKYYWRWKSRGRGRPKLYPEIRALTRQMRLSNPAWGAPRIHGELLKLGFELSEAVVSKYMVRRPGPPSQSWRAFLNNHVNELISLDFFTVPTATFRILFVFVVLSHDRRHIRHFNVTAHPTATWTACQLVESCDTAKTPRYLIRDCDAIYGYRFLRQVKALGVEEVVTAPGSPWQNAYAERVIGSIRRECLDHVIVLGERHLKRVLSSYVRYYHSARTHLSLKKDAPDGRAVQSPEQGTMVEIPRVGGLHHKYMRLAA
jgi:transposase InsO family protein